VFLTVAVAVASYATKADIARGYVVIALSCVTVFDLHHGLLVTAVCVVDSDEATVIADIPALGGIDNIVEVVRGCHADTVAVLACPEMSGYRLRKLAWEVEKTGTDLCVAPALLDLAGPRTTIRPVAGLPLLHLDHPEFTVARLDDGGPALFRQTRVGKDGRTFTVYKFRTMVIDAEQRKADLRRQVGQHSVLFKLRNDPRIARAGTWLRRWSLDELPQLINVLTGDMSMVGPRPALPDEAAMYGDHVRRSLAHA
jgi:hypothetical protein